MTGPTGGSRMRSARCSRRQPPRRRCPPAPAQSDTGLDLAYAPNANQQKGTVMKRLASHVFATVLSISANASAAQYTGYVCEVRLVVPSSTPYGSFGHLQLRMTSSARCAGTTVPAVALYQLTKNATVQGADAAYLLTESQLLAMLNAYNNAGANRTRVRINTNSFGGGEQIQDATFLAN